MQNEGKKLKEVIKLKNYTYCTDHFKVMRPHDLEQPWRLQLKNYTYQQNNNHPTYLSKTVDFLCLTTTIGSENLQTALCMTPVIKTNHLDFLKLRTPCLYKLSFFEGCLL